MESIIECPSCRSRSIKKNGHLSNGKQNYRCKPCGRQFVSTSQEWHVNDSDKDLIDKLLLERISLNGICRVVGISQSWLLNYIKELYAKLPDDLDADQSLPELEAWLEDRMDEEIGRLSAIKKIRFHWKTIPISVR
jgi:DNA-directed RNA polymerase subunit RPC12/RpoP